MGNYIKSIKSESTLSDSKQASPNTIKNKKTKESVIILPNAAFDIKAKALVNVHYIL